MQHTRQYRLSAIGIALGFAGLLGAAHPVPAQTASEQPGNRLAGTMKIDLSHRARDIHWAEGYDPARADLFSHNELLIQASCQAVWAHIVDADTWPRWYPNASGVQIVGADKTLAKGSVFHWTTFGLPLESKVDEFVPYSRLSWYGYAPGAGPSPQRGFYHSWLLVPAGNGCRVMMDEVGRGLDAAHLRETDESLMHRGHDLWLATLKWVSEPH